MEYCTIIIINKDGSHAGKYIGLRLRLRNYFLSKKQPFYFSFCPFLCTTRKPCKIFHLTIQSCAFVGFLIQVKQVSLNSRLSCCTLNVLVQTLQYKNISKQTVFLNLIVDIGIRRLLNFQRGSYFKSCVITDDVVVNLTKIM